MRLHISRGKRLKRVFSIREYPELTSTLRVSDGFLLRTLQVHKKDEVLFGVIQPNILRRIFFLFAFLWRDLPPLDIYRGNDKIGYSIELRWAKRYSFIIENTKFYLLFHRGNYVSFWKGTQQIGLLHTDGSGNYEIKYDSFGGNEVEMLLLFCTIIDCYQFEPSETKIKYYYSTKDLYEDAVTWVPLDEVRK